jgi:phosphoribosylanthranilate isomerase
MSLKIKICGITNKDIIDKISTLNVDHIGFINIERSKRYLDLDEVIELSKDMDDKHYPTLILDDSNPSDILKKVNKSHIKRLQFHSNISIDSIDELHSKLEDLFIIKVIGIKDEITDETIKDLKLFSNHADGILLDYIKDGLTGGTNTHIPIETALKARDMVKGENPNCEIILAGGLNYGYLKSIYENLDSFDMIDVNSGVEDKPGVKNVDKIEDIVNLIKTN